MRTNWDKKNGIYFFSIKSSQSRRFKFVILVLISLVAKFICQIKFKRVFEKRTKLAYDVQTTSYQCHVYATLS